MWAFTRREPFDLERVATVPSMIASFLVESLQTPRMLVLLLLMLQCAGSAVLGRIVMSKGSSQGNAVAPSVIVFWTEVVKVAGCALWLGLTYLEPSVEAEMEAEEKRNTINIREVEREDTTLDERPWFEVAGFIVTHPSTYVRQVRFVMFKLVFRRHLLHVLLPSILFTFQANVIYVALRHLDVAVFQVLHQLKMPLTAILSATVVGVQVSARQWVALMVLFLGVVISQLRPPGSGAEGDVRLGFIAVLSCVASSAVAATMMELIIKKHVPNGSSHTDSRSLTPTISSVRDVAFPPSQTAQQATQQQPQGGVITSPVSGVQRSATRSLQLPQHLNTLLASAGDVPVSVRNVQLAWNLFCFNALMHYWDAWVSGEGTLNTRLTTATYQLGRGLDVYALALVATQASGGVLVSLVLKYANNILKGCAIGLSIVVVGVANFVLFGVVPSFSFSVGGLVVVLGVIMYSVVSASKN